MSTTHFITDWSVDYSIAANDYSSHRRSMFDCGSSLLNHGVAQIKRLNLGSMSIHKKGQDQLLQSLQPTSDRQVSSGRPAPFVILRRTECLSRSLTAVPPQKKHQNGATEKSMEPIVVQALLSKKLSQRCFCQSSFLTRMLSPRYHHFADGWPIF